MKQLIAAILLILSSVVTAQIEGTYVIKNVETGKALRPKSAGKADGVPVILFTPTNWKCMTWDFQSQGGNAYQLKNLFTSKTFQTADVATTGDAIVQQAFVKGKKIQIWEFEPVSEGVYKIKKQGTNLYLTPADKTGAVNSAVVLKEDMSSPLQHWTIYEQHPTY